MRAWVSLKQGQSILSTTVSLDRPRVPSALLVRARREERLRSGESATIAMEKAKERDPRRAEKVVCKLQERRELEYCARERVQAGHPPDQA
ncbi:hypothetical protein [Candidatus Methylacidithermus pantelleriae]|uniref:Uncharacterized protein n=1 Tax=Candidatus Methylacidithermus pantelleriae TaxID=2744239 RepID=A0A8J2FR87_9BACT|nr:hypothetical protein [Candidatus Methylacidithermus pantelleriae]CAF0689126.1 hypothetical protein MPNT_10119 [Candidatus Methylacidithermus pantelleriae]